MVVCLYLLALKSGCGKAVYEVVSKHSHSHGITRFPGIMIMYGGRV